MNELHHEIRISKKLNLDIPVRVINDYDYDIVDDKDLINEIYNELKSNRIRVTGSRNGRFNVYDAQLFGNKVNLLTRSKRGFTQYYGEEIYICKTRAAAMREYNNRKY